MSALRPVEDRIIVLRDDAPEKVGSIIVPEAAKQKPARGIVIAAGPGRHENGVFIPTTINVGDVIHFPAYISVTIEISGKEHVIVRESEVFCVEVPK